MNDMIKESMTYAEFSFLRDLVGAKQWRIWQDKFAKRVKKAVDAKEAYKSLMDYNVKCDGPLDGTNVPLGDIKCCSYLLHRFQVIEQEIQAQMKEAR